MSFTKEESLPLIKRISEEIEAMGLKSMEPAIQKYVEKPKPVEKPLDLASLIEHTLLKPEATRRDIRRVCDEAKRFHFRGVCASV
jgi:hypothetical protein